MRISADTCKVYPLRSFDLSEHLCVCMRACMHAPMFVLVGWAVRGDALTPASAGGTDCGGAYETDGTNSVYAAVG